MTVAEFIAELRRNGVEDTDEILFIDFSVWPREIQRELTDGVWLVTVW